MRRAWILRGEIKKHLLPTDSDDAKFQRIQSHLQIALSPKFGNLFGKMCNDVKYFQIFCNLGYFMHDVLAAATVIIQIRFFFQLGKNQAKTGLDKLLTPTLLGFLAGQ
jgi:hypothetical protein